MKILGRFLDFAERYRPLFLARTRREKVLFAAFLLVIALIWAGTLPGRISQTHQDLSLAGEAIDEQNTLFKLRDQVETKYQTALASLDPEKFPPRQQVVAQLESMARQAGLNPKIDPSTSAKSDRLTFHTINVSFDRVGFARISEFQRTAAAALAS